MPVTAFVDTSAWFALVVPTDPFHAVVTGWLRQHGPALLTTDYVVDETLTLLRSRGEPQRAVELAREFETRSDWDIQLTSPERFRAALKVFQDFDDKEWSFTDCLSRVLIEQLQIPYAISLDHHFRQFGTVIVVP